MTVTTRFARVALAVALSGGGCSAAPDPPPRPAAASPSPTVFDPGFENGGTCPPATGAGLPPRAGCLTSVTADLDGDGSQDELRVFARLSGRRPRRTWTIETVVDAGTTDVATVRGAPYSYPMAVGATDADGDGDDEVFVKIGDHLYHGAGQAIVAIFMYDDGGLTRVRRDGRPLVFRVGGVTQWGEGARCEDADGDGATEFVVHRITTHDHTFREWRYNETVLEWRGSRLVESDRRKGHVVAEEYLDPAVRAYYRFTCDTFDPPPPY